MLVFPLIVLIFFAKNDGFLHDKGIAPPTRHTHTHTHTNTHINTKNRAKRLLTKFREDLNFTTILSVQLGTRIWSHTRPSFVTTNKPQESFIGLSLSYLMAKSSIVLGDKWMTVLNDWYELKRRWTVGTTV